MTQYMLSVYDTQDGTDIAPEELQKIYAAVDTFNDEVRAAGKWVFAGGLAAASSATVVDATGGEPVITDGPYVESKEVLGGFWVVEAADLDEALDLARRGSAACAGKVEVRPFEPEPDA